MKQLPKSQIEFEVTIPRQDWEKYLDTAATEASQEIKIKGFRPGKAPRKIVEQKVGKDIIVNNAAEKAIKKSYLKFITDKKLEVIGSPKVELLKAQEGEDLKYKATVSTMPKIEVKEDYTENIKKINQEFKDKTIEIEEKELELEVEKLAASRVKLITVNREAKTNDSVEVDFEVFINGVPVENGASKNHPIVLGKGVFIPGFEDKIIGMKAGDRKEFELTFPEKYHQQSLAGKPATFKVKVNLVQERQLPEINDEFAKSLGKFEDVATLKKSIEEGMKKERKNKIQDEKRIKYLEEITKHVQGELPDILIQEETKKMLGELEYQIQSMGTTLDQYLPQLKKTKEDLIRDWEPQARKRVLGALALKAIAKKREITVKPQEVEVEMNKTLQQYKNVKDIEKNIDMKNLYNYSKSILEDERVFEFLEKL